MSLKLGKCLKESTKELSNLKSPMTDNLYKNIKLPTGTKIPQVKKVLISLYYSMIKNHLEIFHNPN